MSKVALGVHVTTSPAPVYLGLQVPATDSSIFPSPESVIAAINPEGPMCPQDSKEWAQQRPFRHSGRPVWGPLVAFCG